VAVTTGLVGAGRRAEVHASALAASPDLEFVGVWTRRALAAEELTKRYDVSLFADFVDLLDACEAVCFAVPPAVQGELAGIAARAGKSVLLEVPIAWDLADAERLTETVVAAGVVSQVAFTWRYTAEVQRFLQAHGPDRRPRGGGGRVVKVQRDQPARADRWRGERGLLFDVGPHVADLLDAAIGPVVDVDAEDDENAWVTLRLEHRLVGPSESTLGSSSTIDHDEAVFEFVGADGKTSVDCSDAERTADYATMFAEFANAARTGEAHALDVNRGLHIQRVIEAADTKLRMGR
jgi:predicted dehydrogenase